MTPYARRLAEDFTRPLAVVISILLALVFSVRSYLDLHFLFVLLAFRFWVMSFILCNRFPADKSVRLHQRIFANVSKCIPYFYHAPLASAPRVLHTLADPLGIAGSLLSTWAMIDLGRRFGISPAKRGDVCRSGLYRWFRHPMYLGYAMVEFGLILLNRRNLPIFILSMSSYMIRARMEDKVLNHA
jgi:hypothetical protein